MADTWSLSDVPYDRLALHWHERSRSEAALRVAGYPLVAALDVVTFPVQLFVWAALALAQSG